MVITQWGMSYVVGGWMVLLIIGSDAIDRFARRPRIAWGWVPIRAALAGVVAAVAWHATQSTLNVAQGLPLAVHVLGVVVAVAVVVWWARKRGPLLSIRTMCGPKAAPLGTLLVFVWLGVFMLPLPGALWGNLLDRLPYPWGAAGYGLTAAVALVWVGLMYRRARRDQRELEAMMQDAKVHHEAMAARMLGHAAANKDPGKEG